MKVIIPEKLLNGIPKVEQPLDVLLSDAYQFLVDQYGFTENKEVIVGKFGVQTKEFSKGNVSVYVWAGVVDAPYSGIFFQNKSSGEKYQFRDLLKIHDPNFKHPENDGDTKKVKSILELYAKALQRFGGDFITGNNNFYDSR